MKNSPPNLRFVESCDDCKHSYFWPADWGVCKRYAKAVIHQTQICDGYVKSDAPQEG